MRNGTRNSKSGNQGRQMDFKYISEEEVSVFAYSWMYGVMQKEALEVFAAFCLEQLGRWCPMVSKRRLGKKSVKGRW